MATDFDQLTRNMIQASEYGMEVFREYSSKQMQQLSSTPFDPFNVSQAFLNFYTQLLSDPAQLFERQRELMKCYVDVWEDSANRFLQQTPGDTSKSCLGKTDRRFGDPAWQENMVFDLIRQSYLCTSAWMLNLVHDAKGLDAKTAKKVEFYTRQYIDAMSPSNFFMTNPEVLRTTLETNGENLKRGIKNMLEDMQRSTGALQVRMTDYESFSVGKNLAMTPGKVVYRNELIELIQYEPVTEKVYETPVLILPAWINKYYIVDMQPKNSLVKWLTEQGHSVFVVSWVNPDSSLRDKSFEDYMLDGAIKAMAAVQDATGAAKINTVGYCLGGTLLAATLAYLHKKGRADHVASATYLTTMTDFSDAGELSIFVDDEQLELLEKRMEELGYLEGSEMAQTFAMLRANDLIWSFAVNNYLLGKDPFPFDLLYWNADSTRMPAKMHSFYLRNMYQRNLLAKKNGLTLADTPIDLSSIHTPSLMVSTREDHIAPWKSTYLGTQLFGGPVNFLLAASGHIAGVINPPAKNKYGYWTNQTTPENADAWLDNAQQHEGSWWPYWSEFLSGFSDKQIAAYTPGSGKLKVLGDAPGEYVVS